MKAKPELLAPAGTPEKLRTAILYGADAVFAGGKEFSLRSAASNFSMDDIRESCAFAKAHGADVHITCNIIPHQNNLVGLSDYLKALDGAGVKAVIVADPGIMQEVKRLNLNLEVHVSTQMSVTNSAAVKYFENLGMDRVVLGRETSFEDLKTIRRKCPDIALEYFVHGAMCIARSGRCMLSNWYSGRDANRGGCSQSCRWAYDIEDGGDIPFSMGSKDMCLIRHIPELIDLGVDSFKIEGRMKSIHYIATVVSTYRKLIDAYCEGRPYDLDWCEAELWKAANRAFCEGFYHGHVSAKDQLFNLRDEHPTQEFVLRVTDYDKDTETMICEERNYFKVGDKVEIFSPVRENQSFVVEDMETLDGEKREVANHPLELLRVKVPFEVSENDMGRREKP